MQCTCMTFPFFFFRYRNFYMWLIKVVMTSSLNPLHDGCFPSLSVVESVLSNANATTVASQRINGGSARSSFLPMTPEEVVEVQQVLDYLQQASEVMEEPPLHPDDRSSSTVAVPSSQLKSSLDGVMQRLAAQETPPQAPRRDAPVLTPSCALQSDKGAMMSSTLLEAVREATVSSCAFDTSAGSASPRLRCGGWMKHSSGVVIYAWQHPHAARRLHGALSAIERQLLLMNVPLEVIRPIFSILAVVGGYRISAFALQPLRVDTEFLHAEVERLASSHDQNVSPCVPFPLVEYVRRLLPISDLGADRPATAHHTAAGTSFGWRRDGSGLVVRPTIAAVLSIGGPSTCTGSSLSCVTPAVFLSCPAMFLHNTNVQLSGLWGSRLESLVASLIRMTVDRQPSMMDLPVTFVRDVFHAHGVRLVFLRWVRLELVRRLQRMGCGYWGVVHRLTTEAVARTLKRMCFEHVASVTHYDAHGPGGDRSPPNGVSDVGGDGEHAALRFVMDAAKHSAPLPPFMNRVVSLLLTKPKFVTDVLWPRIAAAFPVAPFLSPSSLEAAARTARCDEQLRQTFGASLPRYYTTGHGTTPAGPSSLSVSPVSRSLSPSPQSKPLPLPIHLDTTVVSDVPPPPHSIVESAAVVDGDASEFDFAKVSLPDVLKYLSFTLGVAFSSSTKQFEATLIVSDIGPFSQGDHADGAMNSLLFALPQMLSRESHEWSTTVAQHASLVSNRLGFLDTAALVLASLRPLSAAAAFTTTTSVKSSGSTSLYEVRRQSGLDSVLALLPPAARNVGGLMAAPLLLYDVGVSEPAACDRILSAFKAHFCCNYASLPQRIRAGTSIADPGDMEEDVEPRHWPPDRSLLHWIYDARWVVHSVEVVLGRMIEGQQLHLSPDASTRKLFTGMVGACASACIRLIPFCNGRGQNAATLGATRLGRLVPSISGGSSADGGLLQRMCAPEPSAQVLPELSNRSLARLLLLLDASHQACVEDIQHAFQPEPPKKKQRKVKVQHDRGGPSGAALELEEKKRAEAEQTRRRHQIEGDMWHANMCARLLVEASLLCIAAASGRSEKVDEMMHTDAFQHSLLKFILSSGFGLGSVAPPPPTVPDAPGATPSLPMTTLSITSVLCPTAASTLLEILYAAIQQAADDSGPADALCSEVLLLAALLSLPHVCVQREAAVETAVALADMLRVASVAVHHHRNLSNADKNDSSLLKSMDELAAEAVVEKLFESEEWLRMIHEVCMGQLTFVVEGEKKRTRKSSFRGAGGGRASSESAADTAAPSLRKVRYVCEFIMSAMESSPSARELLSDVEVVQYPMHRGQRSRRDVPADVMSALVGGPSFSTAQRPSKLKAHGSSTTSNVMVLRRVPSVFGVDDAGHKSQPKKKSENATNNESSPTSERRRSGALLPAPAGAVHGTDDSHSLLMVQSTDEALKRLSMSWALRKQQKAKEAFALAQSIDQNASSTQTARVANSELMRSLTKNSYNVAKGNRAQDLRAAKSHVRKVDHVSAAELAAQMERTREVERARKRAAEDRKIAEWKRKNNKQEQAMTPQPQVGAPPDDDGGGARSISCIPQLGSGREKVVKVSDDPSGGMGTSTSLQRTRESARAWAAKKQA